MQLLDDKTVPTLKNYEEFIISMCRTFGIKPQTAVQDDALASLNADLNTLAELEYAMCKKHGQYAFDVSEDGQEIRSIVSKYQSLYSTYSRAIH